MEDNYFVKYKGKKKETHLYSINSFGKFENMPKFYSAIKYILTHSSFSLGVDDPKNILIHINVNNECQISMNLTFHSGNKLYDFKNVRIDDLLCVNETGYWFVLDRYTAEQMFGLEKIMEVEYREVIE